jgi:hypothetical protein
LLPVLPELIQYWLRNISVQPERSHCVTISLHVALHRRTMCSSHAETCTCNPIACPIACLLRANEGKSRSPCIRRSRVLAVDPAKVRLSPETSVWGLPASVAKSVTVGRVRGYRGFVRLPLWHSLENFPTVGALVQSRGRCPCLGMAGFQCNIACKYVCMNYIAASTLWTRTLPDKWEPATRSRI